MTTRSMPVSSQSGRAISRTTQKSRKTAKGIVTELLAATAGFLFVFPFIWLVLTSLKVNREIYAYPPTFLPRIWTVVHYKEAIKGIPFLRYLRNSLFLCIVNVIGTLTSSTLAAYGFSHVRWPGRDVVFVLVLSTMMLPFAVTMIPLFVTFHRLGWLNTYLPLTVPAFFGSAFDIFLMRQFFLGIPPELSDSAKIDGCSDFGILWRVVLPLSRPVLGTVAIFRFMGVWKDLLGPLLYLNDMKLYTLSLGLTQYQAQYTKQWGALMAACVLFTLPLVVLYFSAQDFFLQGITFMGARG